ncbi:MAG: hypothetical protein GY851_24095, partial [bacterium]|nr:hypothetical protein [bacterium]
RDALKNDPKLHTGARAKAIHFKRSPEVLRLSAWTKAQGITESSGNNFLLFVYLTYREGGRHTLRLQFDDGTYDWQYAETIWKPEKPLATATLYAGMANSSGMAWLDDVYFGPAPQPETKPESSLNGVQWSRKPVTVAFGFEGLYSIDGTTWQPGKELRISQEGVTKVAFKRGPDDAEPGLRVVGIDVTPPVIALGTNPVLEQAGGVYSGTADTEFAIEVADGLSGDTAVEMSVDGGEFAQYRAPFKLKEGNHTLRCRATDHAGNRSDVITGAVLTGGETTRVQLEIR